MRRHDSRDVKLGYRLAFVLALAMAVGGASTALAQNECVIGFDEDTTDIIPADGGNVSCDECDPNCDTDGDNNSCNFKIRVCINRNEAGCNPAEQKTPKIKGKKVRGLKTGLTPNGTNSVCGAFLDYKVNLKKRGQKKGVARIRAGARTTTKPKRNDRDTLVLTCNPSPAVCPTATTTTTTTTGTTVTTSTLPCGNGTVDGGEQCDPGATPTGCTAPMVCDGTCTCVSNLNCCQPAQIVTSSGPGILQVSTLPPFPFPSGVLTTIEAGTADATCTQPAIIPAGGFTVPVFCIPALGFTSQVTAIGCESGTADGNGRVWGDAAPCPDADVSRVGDTSDPSTNNCGTLGTTCSGGAAPGTAGGDTAGNIDTTRGNGSCDPAPGVGVQLDIPVLSTTWNDNAGEANCPDDDLTYNEGTDTLVTQFQFILSPTTATSNSDYTELNADNCTFQGNGPDHVKHCSGDISRPCNTNTHCSGAGTCVDGPVTGIPATGPCCVVGQPTTVVASGIAFTGGSPLFDLIFANQTPSTISACNAPGPAQTCTLTTNACLD